MRYTEFRLKQAERAITSVLKGLIFDTAGSKTNMTYKQRPPSTLKKITLGAPNDYSLVVMSNASRMSP